MVPSECTIGCFIRQCGDWGGLESGFMPNYIGFTGPSCAHGRLLPES